MFDGSFRAPLDKRIAPIGKKLQKAGVSPDVITAIGVAMAAGCGVAIGLGEFGVAVVLLILTGLPDALDGAVANAGGRAGPRGAFLDSVSDRLSDGLLFVGAAWYLGGTDNPRMALLPFGVYLAASIVSYERAKAESLGFSAKGGLMERAERFIALGIGLLFAPIFVPVLWVMLVLTTATAIYRFVKVWKQASAVTEIPGTRRRRRRQRRTARPMAGSFRERARGRAEARRSRRS